MTNLALSENPSLKSPFVMIVYGATGDLMRTKLLPALFSLYKQQELPEQFYIVGFARREFSDNEFADLFSTDDEKWEEFAKHLLYQQGIFEEEKGYQELIKKLQLLDEKVGACITRLFYLATPPQNYETILDFINSTKLSEGCGSHSAPFRSSVEELHGASRDKSYFASSEASRDKQGSNKWTRLIIEKPFGKDLETAKHLDAHLANIFEEKQIFRVDHYLAKETVQNMIAFRFANGIFEPTWNNEFIDHVQITWAEQNGIRNRGNFFEGVGMLRDVAQNHLLQLLATVAMEQPKTFTKEDVRNARAEAIHAIKCIEPAKIEENVVRGQYDGYKNEKDVSPNSQTETFVAFKAFVNTTRFRDVPFYVRAGNKLAESRVDISIVFKQTCHILFKEYGCPEIGNVLTIRIQPNEGISLRVIVKKPGSKVQLSPMTMNFSYEGEFGSGGANAYEKLLLDILQGDQMLFNRSDELESSWQFITNILEGWKLGRDLYQYESGSFGPKEADALIEKDGRKWL